MSLNDISLTAGMRSNLLNLQNTSALLDRTQSRLASGKKVNSALDNPTNFFAAQNHTQRASDLTSRKDGMSEAIQGVQAANKGISGITALIEAGKGLIQSARSADTAGRANLASQFNEVRAQITSLASDSGYKGKNFLKSETLDVLFNENGGSKLTIVGFDATASGLTIAAVSSGTTVTGSVVTGTTALAGTGTTATAKTVSTAIFVADVSHGQVITGVVSGTITSGVGILTETHTATLSSGSNSISATKVFAGATSTMSDGVSGSITLDFSTLSVGASGISLTGGIAISGAFINGIALSAADVGIISGNYDAIAAAGPAASGAIVGNLLSGVDSSAYTGATSTGMSVSFDFTIRAHNASGGAATPNMTVFDLAAGDQLSGLKGAGLSGSVAAGTGSVQLNVFVSGTFAASGSYTITGTGTSAQIVFTGTAIPPGTSVSYTYSTGLVAGVHSQDEITTFNASSTGLKVYLSGNLLAQDATSGYTVNTGTNSIRLASGLAGAVTYALSGHTTGTTVTMSVGATVTTAASVTTGYVSTGAGILTAASGTHTAMSGLTAGVVTGSSTTTAGAGAVTYKTTFSSNEDITATSGVASVTVGATTLTTGFTYDATTSGVSISLSSEYASGLAVSYTVKNANGSISAGAAGTTALTDTTAYVNGANTIDLSNGSAHDVITNQSTFTVGETLTSLQTITDVAISGAALASGSYSVSGSTITFAAGYAPTTGQAITYSITTASGSVAGGWATDTGLDTSLSQLDTALSTLRTQSAALASNLNVVSTRQDFTDGMVNTLLKGADNLTLADMNEEGANMLMLQTRQQLSTTSLKMASDAAQAVLRLF